MDGFLPAEGDTFDILTFDSASGAVEEVFGSSIANDLPLIGDKLAAAATFLGGLRTGLLADLREKVSGNGNIDVTLSATDALLTLQTGSVVARAAGSDVTLKADDFDFVSGENQLIGTGDLTIRSTHNAIDYRIGSAAENASGEDLSDRARDGHVNLGVRDMAALADDWSLVQIGHEFDDNVMQFGDVEDGPTIKYTGTTRTDAAAVRNDRVVVRNLDAAFSTYTINYTNATDGTILLGDGSAGGSRTFTGLEPLSIDGAPTRVVFNLPNTANPNVKLEDIGGANPWMWLSGKTFETTDFSVGTAAEIVVNGGIGADSITVTGVDLQFRGSVSINGGDGNDTLIGSSYGETFNGGGGNDAIKAGAGHDTLIGGAGNDTLDGGASDDVLTGDDGDDKLLGGAGNDAMRGGLGND